MSFSCVLFDLDDTLVDFKKSEALSLTDCYARFFHHLVSQEAFQEHYHRINRTLWNLAEEGKLPIASIGHKRFQDLATLYRTPFLPEISNFYEQRLVEHSSWIEGAEELLKKLQTDKIPIGFVTNGFTHLQHGKDKKLGLSRFSKVLIISEEFGIAKPHPQIFQKALQELNAIPERTLMVGDSLTSDGQGAKNASIPFCWYNPNKLSNPHDWAPKFVIHALNQTIDCLSG